MADTSCGCGAAAGFVAYTSLQPSKNSEAVTRGLLHTAAQAGLSDVDTLEAVVTPKIHGSNTCVYYAPGDGGGVRVGRRQAFITPSEAHYGVRGALAAVDAENKVRALFNVLAAEEAEAATGESAQSSPRALTSVCLYGEVYGGKYPHDDVPRVVGAGPVQKGIWYSPDVRVVFFDVALRCADGSREFLGFDAAAAACARVDLPFVPALAREPCADAVHWATDHVKSNALAWWNPSGLPLLADNAGEGFVVRLVREVCAVDAAGDAHRALAKVKNPAFAEVACGAEPRAPPPAATPEEAAAAVVVAKCVNAARAASVTSKVDGAAVTLARLRPLAALLVEDVLNEPTLDADERAVVAAGTRGHKLLVKACFDAMKAHVAAP